MPGLPVLEAVPTERGSRDPALGDPDKGPRASPDRPLAVRAVLALVQDHRLPPDHVGEDGALARGAAPALRLFPGLVAADLGLGGIRPALVAPAAAGSRAVARLPAHAIARGSGLLEHVVEQVAHVVGDGLHDGEHLLEHVAHEVGGGYAQVFGEAPDVVGELLGDACVQDALLAAMALGAPLAPWWYPGPRQT